MTTMRSVSRALAIGAAAATLAGSAVAPPARAQTSPELKTEEQKTLYAIGLAVAGSLSSFALSPAELELVKSGLTDGVLNRQRQVELQAYGVKIQELQRARATVVAQAPRLAPHTAAMARRIAEVLGVAASQVNVKATSTDGLGSIGRGEGMAALAVAILVEPAA